MLAERPAQTYPGAAMLYEFLKKNRAELIARCRAKAAKRVSTDTGSAPNEYGVPQFLTQLIEAFRVEQTPEAQALHNALGAGKPSLTLVPSSIGGTAALHGDELRRHGLTIDQVVHDYGDLCQALTELALEMDVAISVDEYHTFNRYLDDAIADAVRAYSHHGCDTAAKFPDAVTHDRRDTSARMRNMIEMAILCFATIKGGNVGLQGGTSTLLENSLIALRDVIDRDLADGLAYADAPRRASAEGENPIPAATKIRSP